jgi:hypothetical protein
MRMRLIRRSWRFRTDTWTFGTGPGLPGPARCLPDRQAGASGTGPRQDFPDRLNASRTGPVPSGPAGRGIRTGPRQDFPDRLNVSRTGSQGLPEPVNGLPDRLWTARTGWRGHPEPDIGLMLRHGHPEPARRSLGRRNDSETGSCDPEPFRLLSRLMPAGRLAG